MFDSIPEGWGGFLLGFLVGFSPSLIRVFALLVVVVVEKLENCRNEKKG